VENDANLDALAEHRWGAARGWHNVAYLYLGSAGNGCGLLLDGRLYRGDSGSAGEIGHLMVEENGPECYCGSSGCLDAVVGAPALLTRARALGLPCERIEDVIQLAQQGNGQAVALIQAAGAGLGTVLTSLLPIINPSCVVIGGGIAAAGDLLLRSVHATLQRRAGTAAVDHVTIVPGTLGSDVVALGAASHIIQHVFSSPVLTSLVEQRTVAADTLW
jgi:predicted NBD/HSP70 family sugar kinase